MGTYLPRTKANKQGCLISWFGLILIFPLTMDIGEFHPFPPRMPLAKENEKWNIGKKKFFDYLIGLCLDYTYTVYCYILSISTYISNVKYQCPGERRIDSKKKKKKYRCHQDWCHWPWGSNLRFKWPGSGCHFDQHSKHPSAEIDNANYGNIHIQNPAADIIRELASESASVVSKIVCTVTCTYMYNCGTYQYWHDTS